MRCPLCDTELPAGAQQCTHCDWVREEPQVSHTRDMAAVWLSLVPGLGHVYKGHLVFGAVILFVIGPLVLTLGVVLAPETFGLSMLIPLSFLAGVMVHAYHTPDRRAAVIERARLLNHTKHALV
jgi:hypothetical protein